MEIFSLEGEWADTLSKQGWSVSATNIIKNCLAPSTLRLYNRQINRLRDFCYLHNEQFPPIKASVIADYMCKVADLSNRPNAILTSALAAFNYLYRVLDIANPCDNNIYQLHTALVKSCTKLPRQKVNILPQEPFMELFMSWPENEDLTVSRLRLKTITLLAFTFMLRPSDIAPKSVVNSSTSGIENQLVFSTDRVKFMENGELQIQFFGIKNDTHRDGFSVSVPPASNPKLDPVDALRTYIRRTNHLRPQDTKPVFLTSVKPYRAITASTVAKVLEDAIYLAGLDLNLYSAKCFRPSAATRAIESGFDPDKARRIGRWKTPSVFFEHYVYDNTPSAFTDYMLFK